MALIAIIIVGVLAVSALLGWVMLRLAISAERAQRDPQYRPRITFRHLVFQSVFCAAGGVFCAVQVARGKRHGIIPLLLMVVLNLLSAVVTAWDGGL